MKSLFRSYRWNRLRLRKFLIRSLLHHWEFLFVSDDLDTISYVLQCPFQWIGPDPIYTRHKTKSPSISSLMLKESNRSPMSFFLIILDISCFSILFSLSTKIASATVEVSVEFERRTTLDSPVLSVGLAILTGCLSPLSTILNNLNSKLWRWILIKCGYSFLPLASVSVLVRLLSSSMGRSTYIKRIKIDW